MKNILMLIYAVVMSANLTAQAPEKISYQAVIRNNNNALLSNLPVKMKITISKGSLQSGVNVYSELHSPTTNVNGLVTVEIGGGIVLNGNFSAIKWEDGTYFITTETDPNNGNNYSVIGSSQILSVPFALYATRSSNGLPLGGQQGQVITLCNGLPTWTNGGNCPGLINSLNCSGVGIVGYLLGGVQANSVIITLSYTGGNGLGYPLQSVNSTGVNGLAASLEAGSFANGNGTLTYIISGTPTVTGTALFALNIGGQSCNVSLPVYNESLTTHSCGSANIHNPAKTYENVKDRDGNDYKTVLIGNQVWMAENLKTTKYQNGDPIANITPNAQWANTNTGAYCSYENTISNDCPSGKLYNWFAVNDNRKICPSGWHVPNEGEWNILSSFLGGDDVAGSKLKSSASQVWESSENATSNNNSGFSGLPAGFRNDFGFYDQGFYGYWWSTTENDEMFAVSRGLFYDGGAFYRFDEKKSVGYSVRCLKD